LNSNTSAFSRSAVALSFFAIAWPISFDAALRRAWACSKCWIAVRRASSSFSRFADENCAFDASSSGRRFSALS
jgi:hypothetical protein